MTYEKVNNNQISQKEKDLKLKNKNYLFDELDAAYRKDFLHEDDYIEERPFPYTIKTSFQLFVVLFYLIVYCVLDMIILGFIISCLVNRNIIETFLNFVKTFIMMIECVFILEVSTFKMITEAVLSLF